MAARLAGALQIALFASVLSLSGARPLAAQNPCDYEPYGEGCYWEVSVIPSFDTVGVPVDGFTSHTLMFTVSNTGTNPDTYDLYCSTTGSISCGASYVGAVGLSGGNSFPVYVSYGSTPGHGTLTLTAVGRSVGTSAAGATVLWDPPLRISLTPHNGYHWSAGLCAVSCFNTVMSYSTPAYWTLDAPRAATLMYSSGQAQGLHTVQVDVRDISSAAGDYASKVSVRLQRADNSWVTFTNGAQEIFFAGGWTDGGFRRLAVQFRDTLLATGAYDYSVVVRGYWGTLTREWSEPIRLLVLNERASPYGAGWSVAGAQRITVGPGDSLSTWDGAGTIQFWRRASCDATGCTFTPPFGEFDQLRFTYTASRSDPVVAYTRTAVDGTKIKFDDQGRLRYVDDVFGNRVRYVWRDQERLDSIVDPAGKAIVFGYDGANKLDWIRDVPGNRTSNVTIDASNNLTQIQDPVGGLPFQQATYDGSHRLTSQRDRRGTLWSYTYDFAGRLATDSTPSVTVDSAGQTLVRRLATRYRSPETAVLVDTASHQGTSASPAPRSADTSRIGSVTPTVGSARQFRVDPYGAVIEVLAPATEFARYVRNEHGQVTTAIDSAGYKTFAWDGPRLTQETSPVTGARVNYQWNTATNRITRRYGNGAAEVRNFYDAGGYRRDSTRVGNEPATRFTYDSRGRVLTVTDPRGHLARSFYDGNPWLNSDSVKTGSRRTAYVYEGVAGRPSVVRNPGGRIDSTFYDALNRVTRTGGPLGYAVAYTYGDSLNLTAVTDALGHVRRAHKNAVGWDTLAVGPVNDTTRFAYDKAGQVRRWTNRRGQVTQFDYDSTGRLTSRILADGRIDNLLPGPVRMVSANGEGSDTVRWGRGAGRDTLSEIAVRGGVAYTVRTVYDTAHTYWVAVWRAGAPAQASAQFDLDSAGRVRTIAGPLGLVFGPTETLTYSTDGVLTGINWHSAWTSAFQFRPGHDLARVTYTNVNLQPFAADFVQDTVGQIVQQAKGDGTEFESYTYDVRGRLRGFRRYQASPACPPTDTLSEFGTPCANGTTQLASDTFTYDAAGNRTDKGAAVDAANRLRIFNNDSLSYDPDGNLVRRFRIGDSTAFNQRLYWNSAGQLDSAHTTRQSSTQTVHFGYDAAGRRVRKTVGADTVWYIYSGSRLVAEYSDAGAQLRRYTYLPGMDNPHSVYEGGAYHYYVTDGRANVRALVNANGAVEAEYRYTPYGDTVATSGSVANPVRFAGREFDSETGLYYNRARYYDPQLGRFVSEEGGGLSALNRYTYAGNDPVNGRDPSGRWCEWVQVQKQQAPPVAFASASSGDDHEGKVLYCEDTSGPGGFLSREEQAWLREMYYDPLFLNGSLGLDDPGYFNDGWGGGGAGSALGSGGFERPFPVVAMVRDPALQGCALPGVLLQTRDALRLTKVRWLLWRVAVIDYFMAPGGERIPIPGGGVGVYVGTAAFAEHLETAFGQVLCDAGVGFLTSWDLSS